ncbi:MAG: hypothetical protein ACREQV_15570 [Candidatus Binatia bacterium]
MRAAVGSSRKQWSAGGLRIDMRIHRSLPDKFLLLLRRHDYVRPGGRFCTRENAPHTTECISESTCPRRPRRFYRVLPLVKPLLALPQVSGKDSLIVLIDDDPSLILGGMNLEHDGNRSQGGRPISNSEFLLMG